MPTDVEIAQAHTLEPITTIAARAGIPEQSLIPYGTTKAKIDITTAPTEWLQGKHTIFGAVTDEASRAVVDAISAVETDPRDRPVQDVIITSVDITE